MSVVVLSDLQCPACRSFHEIASALVAAFPEDVRYVHVHLPLAYHEYALPAARLAECAADLDIAALRAWVNAIYSKQDSLGQRPWSAYAQDAGIPVSADFLSCAERGDLDARARAGWAFVDQIAFRGTPAVSVNGWQYAVPPDLDELRANVVRLLAEFHN